jgi:hypothetical protein
MSVCQNHGKKRAGQFQYPALARIIREGIASAQSLVRSGL